MGFLNHQTALVSPMDQWLVMTLCWVTWRIIPVSKLLVLFISHLGHSEGEQPQLGDFLTMVINHLLIGMTLQVGPVCWGISEPSTVAPRFHQEVFVGNSIPEVSGYLMLSRARQMGS